MYRQQAHPEIMTAEGAPWETLFAALDVTKPRNAGDVHTILTRAFQGNITSLISLQTWCLYVWAQSKKPLFVMEEDLAWSLANTEPVSEIFDLEPVLPVNGMYICLPPVFEIENEETGMHKVEGLYLVSHKVAVANDGSMKDSGFIENDNPDFTLMPGITVFGIGEDKGTFKEKWMRDDAIVFFHMVKGREWNIKFTYKGMEELAKVAYNLLWILQNTQGISMKKVTPSLKVKGKRERNKKKALDNLSRKGKSVAPYSILGLTSRESRTSSAESTGRSTKSHMVLGHIHRYWVKDVEGKPVLDTKTNNKGTQLSLVAKWLMPYWKGDPEEADPLTRKYTR